MEKTINFLLLAAAIFGLVIMFNAAYLITQHVFFPEPKDLDTLCKIHEATNK